MKKKQVDSTEKCFVGVDTHKEFHVAVIIDHIGIRLGEKTVDANAGGYKQLQSWAVKFSSNVSFAIEGTGSYGKGLTTHLVAEHFAVFEVDRPQRLGRSKDGKTDTIDAERAARALLAGQVTALPKLFSGPVEDLRNLVGARETLVVGSVKIRNQIRSTLVTAPDDLRQIFSAKRGVAFFRDMAALRPDEDDNRLFAVKTVLKTMATEYLSMQAGAKALAEQIDKLVKKIGPALLVFPGAGPITAANLLIAYGSDPNRIKSQAAFAKLTGTCPVPASSGNTIRHRLNRGGNRAANRALQTIALSRLRCYQPSIDYMTRRLAEGKTKKEIMRCQKRYIAREVYTVIKGELENYLKNNA